MQTPLRLVLVAAAAASLIAAVPVAPARAAGASTPAPTTTVPRRGDPVGDVDAEVLLLQRELAAGAAASVVDGLSAAAIIARSDAARTEASRAWVTADADLRELAAVERDAASLRVRLGAGRRRVATETASVRQVAIEDYMTGGQVPATELSDPALGTEYLQVAQTETVATLDAGEASARQLRQAVADVAAKRAAVARTVTAADTLVGDDLHRYVAYEPFVTDARAAIAATAHPTNAGRRLTIVGPSTFTGAELAAWAEANLPGADAREPIGKLATTYVAVGRALGVRGDVAFAEAVEETGGFTNEDAVRYNNYAGIAHCDTCAKGFSFPSPLAGVKGQLELLDELAVAHPTFATPYRGPALDAREGSCPTWDRLSGVWASDRRYAQKILTIYAQMLEWLVAYRQSHPAVAPGLVASSS